MDNIISHGSNGEITTLYVGKTEIMRYRLSPELLADNPELLAQGRFAENARRKREYNAQPVFESRKAVVEYARKKFPELMANAVHFKVTT